MFKVLVKWGGTVQEFVSVPDEDCAKRWAARAKKLGYRVTGIVYEANIGQASSPHRRSKARQRRPARRAQGVHVVRPFAKPAASLPT